MKTEPFVIERTLNAPAEKVWKAITDQEQMKQWYFDIADFKPEVGFEFTFNGGSEEKTYVHLCKITKVEPGKLLQYSWRYKDYPGTSFVTFELFPEGNATRIKLTHEGIETFPQDSKDFAKESFAAGWTYIIGKSIVEFVEKES
jgi:uncharacterized protein YndB with AHSA1/START domain